MSGLRALVGVELAKLRRSLALVSCVLAPAIVVIFQIAVVVRRGPLTDPGALCERVGLSALTIWAIFMFPLLAALVLTLLFVQERQHGGWQVLYSLPVARWSVVAAKQLVALALLAASTLLVVLFWLAGYQATRFMAPHLGWPAGLATGALVVGAARLVAASLLVLGVQSWVAMRSRGVVGPIGLGVAGVFFATFASGWKWGHLYPWLMPLHALRTTPEKGGIALLAGALGGALLLAGTLIASSRRPPSG